MRRARLLFREALERPEAERWRFVEDACGADAELRGMVEGLLSSDAKAGDFLEEPLARPLTDLLTSESSLGSFGDSADDAVKRLGRYEILGKIGEGGTGSVYLAEAVEDGCCLEVAIKIGRADLGRTEVEARLRKEVEILSALDHPGIARLIDTGTTPEGRPYFVMDYVEGVPILQFCDARRLSAAERIALFRRVCEAVTYAHQNLVVHRDLKPSNILVDQEGQPKLLDFGIAKLLAPEGETTDSTIPTERVLTPSYAAPEQLQGKRITTATDVYSLGVVLYELLTGRRPFEWRGLLLDQIIERWERHEPRKPSIVVRDEESRPAASGAFDGLAQDLADRRQTTIGGLSRLLAGDLDNIVLRALRFESHRRYESVTAFAEDLGRYLEGLPVTARPATRLDRWGRFLRRHAWGVVNAAAVFLLVMGFAVAMWAQSLRLARERDTADRERAEAEIERSRADRERAKAEAVTRFLVSSFELADPASDEGRWVTAREILGRQARWADQDLAAQPEVLATVKHSLGQVYDHLGLYGEAGKQLEQALALRRGLSDGGGLATAETLVAVASVQAAAGSVGAAEGAAREALSIRQQVKGEHSSEAAESLRQLAELAVLGGDLDAALELALAALEVHRPSGEEIDRQVAADLSTLMEIRFHRGELPAAEAAGREALEMSRRVLPADSLEVADDTGNLGAALWALGRYDEAEALFRTALEMHRSRLGGEHPQIASDLNNLASLELEVGNFAEAERLLREGLRLLTARLGEEHPEVARIWTSLGVTLMATNRAGEAGSYFRRALAIDTRVFGERHPLVAELLHHLGTNSFLAGDVVAAEPLLRRALALREDIYAGEGLPLGETEMMMARVLHRSGRLGEAAPHYERARTIFVESGGSDHWLVALARLRLVELGIDSDTLTGLESEARAAIETMAAGLSPDHWRVAEGRSILGALLLALGRLDDARPELEAAYERLVADKGPDALPTRDARRRLEELRATSRRLAPGALGVRGAGRIGERDASWSAQHARLAGEPGRDRGGYAGSAPSR